MSERVLTNRRRRASKGKPIRVSDLVYNTLQKKRANNSKESWDCLFRRMLGLPDRRGNEQPLVEGWLEITTGQMYIHQADARGAAVMEAAKAKTKKVNKPIRMREVV